MNHGPSENENTGGYQPPGSYGNPGYGPPPPPGVPGYGPPPPPGFSDPYQAHQPAYPPPPPGYPGYPVYPQPLSKGAAIGALVTSILLVISCYGIPGIIGLIFSIMAVSESYDQEKVSRFTRYAWIANGVVLGLLVLLVVFVITMLSIGV